MPLDKLRKLLEGLPEPLPEPRIIQDSLKPAPEPSVIQALLKPTPPLVKMRRDFEYLEEYYQDALDNARECNIMDALHEMSQAYDSAGSLAQDVRNAYVNRLITLDEYSETVSSVENFQLFGLPEDIARVILDNCGCRGPSAGLLE